MNARVIALTQPVAPEVSGMTAEGLMIYIARVSSPHQTNPEFAGLLKYCLRNGHWSVFEHVVMTVEIETSMSIGEQILRHRSFVFQKFSGRYGTLKMGVELVRDPNRKGGKNRQAGIREGRWWVLWIWMLLQWLTYGLGFAAYRVALKMGIANEDARFLLPAATRTKLYMTGSVRSWIHYLQARTHEHAQHQHRDVALAIQELFKAQFPVTSEALGW